MNDIFTKTPLLFFIQNLWRDEAFSYVLAKLSIGEIITKTVTDFNPPLYYIVLHYWMLIFGTSEISLRTLSLIFFVGTGYLVFRILHTVFKIPLYRSVIYLIITLFNPFLLTYAFEARMYMMVTFFVTLSYVALWEQKRKLYIIAMALALYTHYFSLFILFAQTIPFLLNTLYIPKNIKTAQTLGKKLIQQMYPLLGPLIFFAPWVFFLLLQHNFSDNTFWIIKPPLIDLWYLPFILYTGYERVFGEYYHQKAGYVDYHATLNNILIIIVILGVIFSLLYPRKNQKELLSLWLWTFFTPVVLFILSYVYQPLFLPRYFIFSSIGLLLLIFVSLETIIVTPFKKAYLPLIMAGIMVIFLLKYTSMFNTWNLKYHSKRNIKKLFSEIKTLHNKNDLIYLTSELDYHLAIYYLQTDENIRIYQKTYDEIPSYVGKVLIPSNIFTFRLPTYPTKAFVVYYSWYHIQSTL